MTVWGDMDYEMQPLPLDDETADRLLAGRVAPEDAPPGYGPVVRLLDAVSAEVAAEELELEGEGVVAFVRAVRSSEPAISVSPRRFTMPLTLSRARLVAAALMAALVTSAGLASAGSLPGAAQDVASEMLGKLGVSVPGANDHAGTHPDGRGSSRTAPAAPSAEGKGSEISELTRTTDATGVEKGAVVSTAASEGKSQAGQHGSAATEADGGSNSAAAANAASTAGKGGEISELATTTDATGVEKGAVISTAASEGKSQAGQNGPASGAGNGNPPVTTPNGGGTGTADTASGGASSQGTSTADAASGGHSSAGSANAGSGNSQKP
jgi:hypothetical protein